MLFEADYTIQTGGLTMWSGVRAIAGVLIVGSALWQAIVPERMDEMDPGWWTYVVIIGTIGYIIDVVLKML